MIEYENLNMANRSFRAELLEAFTRVLDSGWFVLGNEVKSFEEEFAHFVGGRHCIGVANGLDALTLSLKALELPQGSEVLVASNTYIATILAILHAGLVPVLVEPDFATLNIDPTKLKKNLTSKTRAICVTHLYGKPCRMDEISFFAQENGLFLVEDCAQSHGAKFKNQMTGTFGIAGCFSFYPTKNLGALGDAGAIVTNDDEFADKLRHWRNYGSKQKYVNHYPGYNSRLDEVQAALLRVKLPYLDAITQHKRNLASVYFNNLPSELQLPQLNDDEFDVFHIYQIRHQDRDKLRQYLLDNNVKTEIHYPTPPHKQIAMARIIHGEYPIASEIHRTVLSLPISFSTTVDDALSVCNLLNRYFD